MSSPVPCPKGGVGPHGVERNIPHQHGTEFTSHTQELEVMCISLNPCDPLTQANPECHVFVEYSQLLTWAFNHDIYRPVGTAPQNLQPLSPPRAWPGGPSSVPSV